MLQLKQCIRKTAYWGLRFKVFTLVNRTQIRRPFWVVKTVKTAIFRIQLQTRRQDRCGSKDRTPIRKIQQWGRMGIVLNH